MFKFRIISFPLLLLIFFLMLFWQPAGWWIFAVVSTGAIMLLTHEFVQIVEKLGFPVMRRTAIGAVGAIIAAYHFERVFPAAAMIMFLIMALPLFMMIPLIYCQDKAALLRSLFPTIGTVYLLLLIYFPLIIAFPAIKPFPHRPYNFLFLVLVTKAMDTGGYVFGLLSNRFLPGGNHKIMPKVSPKKSWEGFFGGIFASVLVAFIISFCCDFFSENLHWWKILTIAVVLAIGSFFGDLTESALKRSVDIKDSGNYIPGMGGVFDVLDSFIYNGWIWAFLGPVMMR